MRIKQTAKNLAEAADVEAASLALGRLGADCGACHASVGANVELADSQAPAGTDAKSHMQRHLWAADRMWEGLIGPKAERFTGGASALVEAPLHPHAIEKNKSVTPEIAKLAEAVHRLAEGATRATEAQYAQFYGEYVATCAACHTRAASAPK